ncbi:MAG: ATP synthase F0 subunit B [Puniceicoccales bacterium]|jgi:F-type H+-transporting ATPase subunit b|nr:ATP synthase F0 subunit B [Puniceicoccales bacterium]
MNAALAVVGQLSSSSGTVSKLAAEFHVEWPLLAAQILNFTVVALLLYRFAVGPLLRVIDERRRTVQSGLVDAEKAAKKLAASDVLCHKKQIEAGGEAKKIIGDAKLAADALALDRKKQMDTELAALRTKEAERISAERDAAIRSAVKELRLQAAALSEKILRTGIDEDAAAQFSANAVRAIESANG